MEYSNSLGNVEADPGNNANTSNPISSEIVVAEPGVLVVQPHEVSYLQVLAKPPSSRKILLMSLLCTAAIATSTTGVLRWQYARTHEVTDKAYVTTDTYAVNSKIPGQVVSVSANENQVVKKGSVLVKLNPSQYQAKVKRATTILEQAQQQVKKAATDRDTAKAKIKNQPKVEISGQNDPAVVAARLEAKTRLSELKRIFPAFAKASVDYERFVKLHSLGFIPIKTLQDTKTKYDDLFKQYNSSTAQVKLARTKLTTAQQNYLDGQIKLAQQKIEEARKNSQEAQAKLQQKMELDSKKILESRTKLQQKMQEDSKNRLLSQTELQQKIKQDGKKLQANELKANEQKIEKLKAEQLKAEKLQANELKANDQKVEKLKADHQKAIQQLEKQFAAKREQQDKTIARLTEQKTVVVPRLAETEILLLDYEKSQLYLKSAQTALSQAARQLKDAEYQLYYTKITAPNNGQINIKRAQTGQKVEPGQTLMSLVPQKLWIAADFEDEQLKKIKPGQSVQIQLKSLTDKTFTGKVQSILPLSKTKYNHLRPPVKISFDPKILGKYKLLITPGTPASVKVEI
ncbi:secretion protein HlyD [Calothrix sp. NIES-4071]|nr:secretion protein HlyD [Calothrix sp. NIES-4071]BAZ61341.1 secretion protein HlyD [Calothrix sp. NIES-4105]